MDLADIIPDYPSEEYLVYDGQRFHILDPLTGLEYGTSSDVAIPLPTDSLNYTNPRIISRYDSTYRRLVFRDGDSLRIYRFGTYLASDSHENSTPQSFALHQNYPNPFNPNTEIIYELSKSARVSLKVFDLLGREIATLVNQQETQGTHKIAFNGSTLASGVYLYRLEAEGFSQTQKMLLLK